MRCKACNNILTDLEASRKYATIDEYVDLCNPCLQGTGIIFIENPVAKDKVVEVVEESYIPDFYEEALGG